MRSVRNRQRRSLYLAIGVESVEMRVTVKPSENKPTGQRIVVTTAESSEEAIKIAKTEMEAALEISVGALVEEHQNAWKDLAHTGIHLDPTDPGFSYYFQEDKFSKSYKTRFLKIFKTRF